MPPGPPARTAAPLAPGPLPPIGGVPDLSAVPSKVAESSPFQYWYVPPGDPKRGAAAIEKYGCPSCHTIDGLPRADGLVGPPLTNVMQRVYIAGFLINVPENTMYWIMHAQKVLPWVDMPMMGVTPEDARDIVAFLLSLTEE